jgi:hypothetical protein
MAKKKKSGARNKQLRKQVNDLKDIEKRLQKVRKNVQTFLDQSPGDGGPGGGPESLRPK